MRHLHSACFPSFTPNESTIDHHFVLHFLPRKWLASPADQPKRDLLLSLITIGFTQQLVEALWPPCCRLNDSAQVALLLQSRNQFLKLLGIELHAF